MDLQKYDVAKAAEDGAILVLKHPVSKEPLKDEDGPLSLMLRGRDSSTFKKKDREQSRSRLAAAKRSGDSMLETFGNVEETEKSEIELLASCTIGWSDNMELGGAKLTYSYDNAVRLYTEQPWVMEQVRAFMTSRANFLKS